MTIRVETLSVVESTDCQSVDSDTFVVERELGNADPSAYKQGYRTISQVGRDADRSTPFLSIYWPQFANPQNVLFSGTTAETCLTHRIVLYERLEARIEAVSPSRIEFGDVDEAYRATVTDVAEAHGIEVIDSYERAAVGTYLAGMGMLCLLFADQLLAMVLRALLDRPHSTTTLFVPKVNRPEEMMAVLEAYDEESVVLTSSLTAQWLAEVVTGSENPLFESEVFPLGIFAGPRTVLSEFRFLVTKFPRFVFGRTEGERLLSEAIATRHGVDLSNSVAQAFDSKLRRPVAIFNTRVTDDLVKSVAPEKAVFGSAGPNQMAMMRSAVDNELDSFQVAHGVTPAYGAVPPAPVTFFVESENGKQYLQDSEAYGDVSNVVVTGRPYFSELFERRSETVDSDGSTTRVLLGTQPYRDSVRRRFVEVILEATAAAPDDIDVVIKTHPDESTEFYHKYERGAPNVEVVSSGLHERLAAADIVFTIVSNVGLEAMILGTPCVCYNEWQSLIAPNPYMTNGPVPIIDTLDDILEYLNTETLTSLQTEIKSFTEENYLFDPPPEEQIVMQIDYTHCCHRLWQDNKQTVDH